MELFGIIDATSLPSDWKLVLLAVLGAVILPMVCLQVLAHGLHALGVFIIHDLMGKQIFGQRGYPQSVATGMAIVMVVLVILLALWLCVDYYKFRRNHKGVVFSKLKYMKALITHQRRPELKDL